MAVVCKECNVEFSSNQKFSKHLKNVHNMTMEQYFLKHVGTAGSCATCGQPTTFHSMGKGYNKVCGSRVCAGKYHRAKLKQDVTKFESFRQTVSAQMKESWATGSRHEQHDDIVNKVRNTRLATLAELSPAKMKERFGWMNKLSPEDKQNFIRNVLMKTGMHVWWQNASEDEKQDVIDRRAESLRNTWDVRGSDIMNKIMASCIKNGTNTNIIDPDQADILEHEYKQICMVLGADPSTWEQVK